MEQHAKCVAILLLLLLTYLNASEVKFAAYPQELKLNLTEAASMRCSVTDTEPQTRAATSAVDIQHISSIFITKNGGEDVASLTPHNGGMALTDAGNLDVKGAFSGLNWGESYIELSWSDPAHLSLGVYQCTVTAVDAYGRMVQLNTDLELTAAPPSLTDVIAYMKKKDESQQQQIENQASEIASQASKIESQASKIESQASEIKNLQDCARERVAFTAVLSAGFSSYKLTVPDHNTVIYDKIVYNEGSSYDTNTGLFTCTTAGIYSFTVSAVSYSKQVVCLQLQLNSAEIVSIYAYDSDYYDSASNSALLHLNAGDVVRVWAACTSEFTSHPTYRRYGNSFSGALVKADSCTV